VITSAIAQRLQAVRDEMNAACTRAHRAPDAVTLVAVSKGHPASAIRTAHAAGQRHFGENYADELVDKMRELADVDVTWHFIGRVQSGNAKTIARSQLVHGVGSTSQAQSLHKAALKQGKNLPVFLQVNLENEDTKNGMTSSSLPAALAALRALHGLTIVGLMSMPDVDDVRAAFAAVRALRDRVAPDLPWLSMGMSGDFATAIEEGATHVRVGTAIFGPRPSLTG
jgi:pyridoxal phosphate enzyme (YggS family)